MQTTGGNMFGWLKNQFNERGSISWDPPQPDEPIYVVGDIHGQIHLLDRLLAKMGSEHRIVFVGDYVDRGRHSAKVLRRLFALSTDSAFPITCLLGNHEAMMLGFLRDPVMNSSWLRHGGRQTIASFGLPGIPQRSDERALLATRDHLAEFMGDGMIRWLRTLPSVFQSGNLAVVHAAADPTVSIPEQKADRLTWGHPDFGRVARKDGIWIAHGHTIVEEAVAVDGIISVDTGAYATDRLTAAFVTSDDVEFICA
ncbi:MAG: metallophosphoesterase [Paracoccaceae bacterium]